MATHLSQRGSSTSHRRSSICIAFTSLVILLTLAACLRPTADVGSPDVSRATLTAAASALDKRDATAFLQTLSTPLREGLGDSLDLSGAGSTKLAKVLRDAKIVAEYDQVRVYESKLDAETVTFFAVREGDKWLLTGL
jgi:hypothetical protein